MKKYYCVIASNDRIVYGNFPSRAEARREFTKYASSINGSYKWHLLPSDEETLECPEGAKWGNGLTLSSPMEGWFQANWSTRRPNIFNS